MYLAPTTVCSQAEDADPAWTPIAEGSNGTAGAERGRAGGVKTSSLFCPTDHDRTLKID